MSIAAKAIRTAEVLDRSERSADFLTLARLTAKHKGALVKIPTGERHSSRVTEIISAVKSTVPVGSLADPAWAGALAPYAAASDGFLQSLRSASAFDSMLPSMRRAPMHTSFTLSTTAVTGSTPSEGSAKPVSFLTLNSALLQERKATAIIAASKELFEFATPAAIALVDSELRAGVVAATNTAFVGGLIAATTPIASSGATTAAIFVDLGALLSAVSVGANSRTFLILHPDRAKNLILKLTTGGIPAFPGFSLGGGEIAAGVTGLVSSEIASDAVLLVAADGLVADASVLTLRYSEQALLEMNSAPDSPLTAATVPLSLWQQGAGALLCERFFAFSVARATAIASLSGVAW